MEAKNNEIKNPADDTGIQEEKPKYKISHLVSANRLKVYVRIDLNGNDEVNYEDIIGYLRDSSIVYGIKENEIKEYCSKKEFIKELTAAAGLEPIDGKDAEHVYDIDISKEKKFAEKKDGTIDFQDFNNILNVKKDELLCHIIPSEEGTDGIDVYGNKIPYKAGKNANFNHGKNTYVTDDGLQLRSGIDGCVKILNGKVTVDDVYIVNNVNNETGNINFVGSVTINGDVKAGFSVKARNDIRVRGMVEGAYIEAGNDVIINKGMNGMGKGYIYAKGNITSKYIENAVIKSGKNVYAEALINSDVTAKESIILKGQNAAILGGVSRANDMIYAKTIGSKTYAETKLVIDLGDYMQKQSAYENKNKKNQELIKQLNAKNNELKAIDEKIDAILKSNLNNKNSIHKRFIFMRLKLNNEINQIKNAIEESTPDDNLANHKIVCKGTMYTNTRINIGWIKYRVRQDISFSKIYNDGNDISIITLVPSDLL